MGARRLGRQRNGGLQKKREAESLEQAQAIAEEQGLENPTLGD